MASVALVACVACGDSQDDGISTSVGAKLTADQAAGTSQVKVATNNGVVTLSGTADTPAAKEQAVRAARATEGVKEVVDNIEVKSSGSAASGGQGVGESAARAGDAVVDTTKATGDVVAEGAKTTGNAVAEGAKTTGNVVVEGAKTTGSAVVKGTETAVKATGDAAKATGDAAVKGAEATASGAKKLGSGIVGAVTPDKEKK
jgi:hyperosmotically inducible protein